MSKNSQYVNGIFIQEQEGQFGPYLSIGISEEGLENLRKVAPNAKGVRNFIAGRQKENNAKFSVKPSVPKGSQASEKVSDDLPW